MPMGVTYGLVTGISDAMMPAGFAYLTIPFSGISSMMPMLFCRSASRRMPRTFARRFGSGLPIPLSSTLIRASRVAVASFPPAQAREAGDDEQQRADFGREPEVVEDRRHGAVDVERDRLDAFRECRFECTSEPDAISCQAAIVGEAENHRDSRVDLRMHAVPETG